jgi:16S rRNA (guanine527-N7)-methyltransferase
VNFEQALSDRLAGIVSLSKEQLTALRYHFEEMIRWNRRINLTSITNPEEVLQRHYCESLFLASRLPTGRLRVIDVGSGAGFPGFPVAVVRPDCEITLVESHQRKAVFLRHVSRELHNVKVTAVRAESVTDHFDWLVSRAVAWRDLEALSVLADRLALLVSLPIESESASVRWESPFPLPWDSRKAVIVGEVSRGTLVA